MKRVIVFSGINITSGGPLTILRNIIAYADRELSTEYEVFALVKSRDVFDFEISKIKLIEFPNAQRTFFHKLYYEYFYFRKLSVRLNPFLWMSLNDCTPSVKSERRCVYIHNATSIYKFTTLDFRFPSRILLQKFYYRFFLRANLNRNDFVIVQQKWLGDFVINSLGYRKKNNVLLHRPIFDLRNQDFGKFVQSSEVIFIYPTKAEVYKNIHTLIEAFQRVTRGSCDATLLLTIDGTENRYSRYLKYKAASNKGIKFVGTLGFNELIKKLGSSHALVFPSKLETWGLPLSEARSLGKLIIASDMPYARETLSGYGNVLFFDPDSPDDLSRCLHQVINRSVRNVSETFERKLSGPSDLHVLFNTILLNQKK
jgi:glycosyltransferase involved in cell wall biosynthesis